MADCTRSFEAMKPSEALACASQGIGNVIRRFTEGLDNITVGQWAEIVAAIAIIVAAGACVVLTLKFFDRLIARFSRKGKAGVHR